MSYSKSFFYPNVSLHDYPILSRYPNPYSSHVVASDTVKAFTKEINGKNSLIIERLHTKVSRLHVPYLSRNAFVLEKVIINDKIEVFNMNISHKKWMTMIERQKITEEAQSYKKYGITNGVYVKINTTIRSKSSWIQQFCLNNYKENVKIAQNGMKHVLESMGWRMPS